MISFDCAFWIRLLSYISLGTNSAKIVPGFTVLFFEVNLASFYHWIHSAHGTNFTLFKIHNMGNLFLSINISSLP